jgi:hypothetical protein
MLVAGLPLGYGILHNTGYEQVNAMMGMVSQDDITLACVVMLYSICLDMVA